MLSVSQTLCAHCQRLPYMSFPQWRVSHSVWNVQDNVVLRNDSPPQSFPKPNERAPSAVQNLSWRVRTRTLTTIEVILSAQIGRNGDQTQ